MNLINNILDIAKMEAGRVRLQLKTASLAGVAGRAIDILEQLARAKNVSLVLAAEEEFSLELDADMIERVFTNLIGNAIKYTPEGGTVTVTIRADGPNLKCEVADTGEGIPPDYLSRVFEKFEQVQGQRRGGTGLGLTISRFFVEAHLGRIWAESDPPARARGPRVRREPRPRERLPVRRRPPGRHALGHLPQVPERPRALGRDPEA